MQIRITSSVPGFRRAGVAHPQGPETYPADTFSEEQHRQLQAEPRLLVEVLEDDDNESHTPSGEDQSQTGGVDDSSLGDGVTAGTIDGVVTAEGEQQDLSELKVDELRALAKDLEIAGYSDMKKVDLISAIKAEQVEVPAAEAE